MGHLRPGGGLGHNVVFLLTPSFTSWSDLSHKFIPDALRHMYLGKRTATERFTVQSYTAIVDALPGPGSCETYGAFTTGHEGLAVLVTSTRPSVRRILSNEIESFRPEAEKKPFISFRFWRESAPDSLFKTQRIDLPNKPKDAYMKTGDSIVNGEASFVESGSQVNSNEKSTTYVSEGADSQGNQVSKAVKGTSDQVALTDEVTKLEGNALSNEAKTHVDNAQKWLSLSFTEQYDLPLANTLFQNGKKFTLYKDLWNFEMDTAERNWDLKSTDSTGTVQREEPSHLRLTIIPDSIKTNLPLVPLTQTRKVVSAVGNVISQLSGEDDNSALPASTELEKMIPTFIEQQGIQSGDQVRVFALITSSDRMSAKQVSLEDILRERGSRLHRVTSGGGGWGKKAGLLSLDPALGLDHQEMSDLMDSDVVAAGDQVQFLIAVNPGSSNAEQRQAFRKGYDTARDATRVLSASPGAGSILLGMIPPKDDPQYNDVSLLGDIERPNGHLAVFPKFFGMLTEQPMCMSSVAPNSESDEDGQQRVLHDTSMIGVPYASVAVKTMSPPGACSGLRKPGFQFSKLLRAKSARKDPKVDKAPSPPQEKRQIYQRSALANLGPMTQSVPLRSRTRRGVKVPIPKVSHDKLKETSKSSTGRKFKAKEG